MRSYYCRCGAWLLNSDAEVGRIEVCCRDRRCGRRQTVFLGGKRTAEEVARLRAESIGECAAG